METQIKNQIHVESFSNASLIGITARAVTCYLPLTEELRHPNPVHFFEFTGRFLADGAYFEIFTLPLSFASIPNFLIRDHSVERLSPSNWAAPLGPASTPPVFASACKM